MGRGKERDTWAYGYRVDQRVGVLLGQAGDGKLAWVMRVANFGWTWGPWLQRVLRRM